MKESGIFLTLAEAPLLNQTASPNAYGVAWLLWLVRAFETLFAALKSRGFKLEASHLQHDERISKLLALLAVAFAWAHLVGEWLHEQKPIPIKKHGRLAKSFFRYGLDHLHFVLLNIQHQRDEFFRCLRLLAPLKVLSCT